jgi:clan AA aspartic protease (TIGR02281 family)
MISALVAALICLSGSPVAADLFQYTDKDGTVVIVDDESKIPASYRKKSQASRSSGGSEKYTGVTVRGNKVIVPVTFSYRGNQVQGRMLLDTGASLTAIFPGLANRLGIQPDHGQRAVGRIADGSYVEAQHTRVEYMQVGPKVQQNSEVVVLQQAGPSMGFDGLLGMSFLGDFRYHVNLQNSTIEWQ